MRPDESIAHPSFCLREGCSRPHGDIVHRGPAHPPLALAEDGGVTLGFEPVRCDQRDSDGRQVVHDPEVLVNLTPTGPPEAISIERAEAILVNLFYAVSRARGLMPAYSMPA